MPIPLAATLTKAGVAQLTPLKRHFLWEGGREEEREPGPRSYGQQTGKEQAVTGSSGRVWSLSCSIFCVTLNEKLGLNFPTGGGLNLGVFWR